MWDTLFDLAIKGTALFAGGWLVTLVMIRASAASRHAVWAAVCVAALVLPVAQAALPSLDTAWWPRLSASTASLESESTPDARTLIDGEAASPVTVSTAGESRGSNWIELGIALWFVGVAVGLWRLGRGRRKARTLASSAAPATDRRLVSRADLIGGWLGVPAFSLRLGDRHWMPSACGIRRPVVVLPASAAAWTESRLDPVLVHELAHIARRDALWQQVSHLMVAIWWVHPLAWVTARRLQVERERACDDLVLEFGARASDYATELVALAGECAPAQLSLAMARRSQLEGRVMAILNPGLNRNGRTGAATLVAAGVVLAMTLVAPLTSAHVEAVAPVTLAPTEEAVPPAVAVADNVNQPQQPVRVGGVIRSPQKIRHVSPEYPEIARTAGVQGVVIMEVVIDEAGLISDAKVVRSVALLDRAAVEAVRQWRFTPTTLNGAPVPVLMAVTVNFRLDENGQPINAVPPPPPSQDSKNDTVSELRAQLAAIEAQLARLAADAPPPTWTEGEPPLRIGGVIKEPRKTRHVAPVYPEIAQQARVQGVVIIEATIDQDGRVTDAKIIRPVALLDEAALEAVSQWEFEPTLLNGRPVPVRMTMTVNFTLG